MIEQKQIVHLAFGKDHMMALDRVKQLYGWGEGNLGCLGFGDNRKKMMPLVIPFFENKHVIDVACGDSFTVVIAEVEGDPSKGLDRTITKEDLSKVGQIKTFHKQATMLK